ncbi:MAG: SDR family oxidoreductase [Planctomycetota bacterium]
MSSSTQTWSLVTGASSGLGADFARQLAEQGRNVILVARREQALKDLALELREQHGVLVEVVVQDLGAHDAAQQLFTKTETSAWNIDVLINNAGFGYYGNFLEQELDRVQAMLDLDISTVMGLTHLFGTAMKARGTGRILQVASVAAYQATPTYAAYAAAKAFVLHFGEALNHEWKGSGVSCTTLSPGITATDFLKVSGQKATFYQRLVMMQSPYVVKIGLRALFRGKPSIVPGIMNKITAWSIRTIPRTWATAIGQMLMKN